MFFNETFPCGVFLQMIFFESPNFLIHFMTKIFVFRMWYPVDGNNTRFRSISVMARVKVIRENWNLKYSACFILCPLRISYLDVPYSVSVVSKLRSPPGNILMLRNTDSVSFCHFPSENTAVSMFPCFRIQILPIEALRTFRTKLPFVSSLYTSIMIR